MYTWEHEDAIVARDRPGEGGGGGRSLWNPGACAQFAIRRTFRDFPANEQAC